MNKKTSFKLRISKFGKVLDDFLNVFFYYFVTYIITREL